MPYVFVDERYPVSDPNIDLNFNNDILYSNIVGDVSLIAPLPYDNNNQIPRKSRPPTSSDIIEREPSYNIFMCFIMIVILVLIIMYTINDPEHRSHHYADVPATDMSAMYGRLGYSGF